MKPLLGKQVVAGAWGREDTLKTSSLPSEKGATAVTLQASSGQQAFNTHQSPQQTLLRPSRYLLIMGKEPILIEQTFAI